MTLCARRLALLASATVLGLVLILPADVAAQDTSITGVVTDTTGAVLPGVSVDAGSPVLIEGSRTAITDSQGVYRIIDLRPGTYRVTFTLPGFRVVVREGVQLNTGFTATINI
ncbi:MAG: carboxypeptidase regulatory-like domain-containing protein [Acidimicrobiia bacterium]|nr:carboxypeptidase regulatory-like domain-containing protein [Acidimicrobiia bacterium]